jgi:ABC-type transporter lipoprotein component MlaA
MNLFIHFTFQLLCVIILFGQGKAQETLYQQKVVRDDQHFRYKPFLHKRGMLSLTNDSVKFETFNSKFTSFNFSFPYHEIKSIRVFYGYIVPNRIKIRLTNGTSYRLFTYRKKEIIAKTREKMQATR